MNSSQKKKEKISANICKTTEHITHTENSNWNCFKLSHPSQGLKTKQQITLNAKKNEWKEEFIYRLVWKQTDIATVAVSVERFLQKLKLKLPYDSI